LVGYHLNALASQIGDGVLQLFDRARQVRLDPGEGDDAIWRLGCEARQPFIGLAPRKRSAASLPSPRLWTEKDDPVQPGRVHALDGLRGILIAHTMHMAIDQHCFLPSMVA